MSTDSFGAVAAMANSKNNQTPPRPRDPEYMKRELQKRFETFQARHEFKAGDLVRIKPGLRRERFLLEGEPAIVLEVLDSSIVDKSKESGSPYYRDKIDIVCASLDSDGDFLKFHYESRYLEPWTDPPTEAKPDPVAGESP